MSNFFGFHGEHPSEKGLGGVSGGAISKTVRKKSSSVSVSNAQSSGPAMIANPLLKQNANTMTYNGMYNVAAVAPPPLNQRPARKASTRSQSQIVPLPNAPFQQQTPVVPPMPINAPRNPTIPTLTAGPPPPTTALSELQAKVAQWKHKRTSQSVSERALPDVFPHNEQNEPEYDDQKDTNTTTDVPVPEFDQYKAELNRTVDSVRREVSALRAEIAALTDTVKLLNPGNQTSVIRMVEQQVQKIVVDQNRINSNMEQMQMISKSQQNQIDEWTRNHAENGGGGSNGVSVEDLDEVIEGLSEEQKKAMTDLENTVKTALQNISDRSHWIYGIVLQDTLTLYESHELGSRKKSDIVKGSKVQLTYPMKRTNEGTWMKVRTVAEDGSLFVSWAPIWTFTPEVLQKYSGSQPPAEEEKLIYLGGFTLC
jgi:hypothetical protein